MKINPSELYNEVISLRRDMVHHTLLLNAILREVRISPERLSQLERKVSILEANKASKYEGDVG